MISVASRLLSSYFRRIPKPAIRPFLIQSDLAVENGVFRLEPKWGFLKSRKRAFSTENSDWRIQ